MQRETSPVVEVLPCCYHDTTPTQGNPLHTQKFYSSLHHFRFVSARQKCSWPILAVGYISGCFTSELGSRWKHQSHKTDMSHGSSQAPQWHPSVGHPPGIEDGACEITKVLENRHGILQLQDFFFFVFEQCQGKPEYYLMKTHPTFGTW